MRSRSPADPLIVRSVLIAGLVVASCAGTGDGGGVPRALRERASREEVRPFGGFAVPGLRLYVASGSVPDHGWSTVLGIDGSGAVVEGAALMRRLGPLEPAVFAGRALAILLGSAGAHALDPGDERPAFASAQEWSVVHPPSREDRAVVFFVMRGEMSPQLTEVRVDTSSFAPSYRSAHQVLLASGQEVVLDGAACEPLAECGCWVDCVRLERVLVPGSDVVHYRRASGDDRRRYVRETLGASGLTVCRADTPSATCDPGLVPSQPIDCERGCPGTDAPFHCETLEDVCRRVPHPIRAAR